MTILKRYQSQARNRKNSSFEIRVVSQPLIPNGPETRAGFTDTMTLVEYVQPHLTNRTPSLYSMSHF